MELTIALQLKNLGTLWLLLGNGLLTVWAGGLYLGKRPPSRAFFNITLFLQLLVVLVAAIGVYLLIRGAGTNPGHVLYGVLNGLLAVLRIGLYPRFAHAGGSGALWHGFLALLQMALVFRSSVTALHV